jgi:hypothetical protein
VPQGFSVRTSQLHAGSEEVAGLQSCCQAVGQDAVVAMTAMVNLAGHAGLASALSSAAERGTSNDHYNTFTRMR